MVFFPSWKLLRLRLLGRERLIEGSEEQDRKEGEEERKEDEGEEKEGG